MRRLVLAAVAFLLLLPVVPAAAAAGQDPVRVLVTLEARTPDVPTSARATLPAGGRLERTWSAGLKGYAATVPAAAVPALSRARGVVRVERDIALRATGDLSAGLDRVDQRALPLDGAYRPAGSGAAVTAYVVDTGIRLSHLDFGGRARTGYDAVTRGGSAQDCNGHGTHVAGTVGGATFGVARGVALSSVRVLDCDGAGSSSWLIAGLDFVLRDHRAGTPAVAVLSLGGDTTSATVDDAVRHVVADGVTVVVAAGNSGTDACEVSPARVAEALTIGATSSTTDARAGFSNTGPCLDLFAPGTGILSAGTASDTASAYASGTSMAAPHVAGAAALLLEADPSADPATVGARVHAQATSGVVTDARSPVADLLHVPPAAVTVPVVEEPVAEEPVAEQPVAPSADALLPAPAPSPAAPAPVVTEPVVTEPVVAEPVVAEPVAAAPVAAAPVDVPAPAPPEDLRGRFTPVAPARALDTRDGTGGLAGRLAPGAPVVLPLAGLHGLPVGGVTAVALNVTVTAPEAAGHLTVYPAGHPVPTASSLNHVRGQTVANLVVAAVDASGRVSLRSNAGRPHVVADVVGFFSDTAGGSRAAAVTPARLLDTRSGAGGTTGRLRGGEPVALQVTGRSGVPADGVTAVVLNVTATGSTGPGHLTVFPGGLRAPLASSLNFPAGRTVPNLVVVGVGPQGDVQLQANAGSPHVLVDVVGWFGTPAAERFVPLAPARVLDSRTGAGRLAPGQELVLPVAGHSGVPRDGVGAVLLNVTVAAPLGTGHLTVFPAGARAPEASNLNHVAGQTVPNLVLARVDDGAVRLRSSGGWPHLVVDVVGYTAASVS